jgi:Mg2+/citrate symporter
MIRISNHGVVCCVSSGTSLLAKGGKIFLILIPQYVGTFLHQIIGKIRVVGEAKPPPHLGKFDFIVMAPIIVPT